MQEAIIKTIYSKTEFAEKTKKELLDLVIGDDKSDLAENLKLGCEARYPSKKVKNQVWAKIIDPENSLSRYQRKEYMQGFFQRDEFCPMFVKNYVSEVKNLATHGDSEFMVSFVENTYPLACANDYLIKDLNKLLTPYKDNSKYSYYYKTVKDVIETLEISQKVKEFARA